MQVALWEADTETGDFSQWTGPPIYPGGKIELANGTLAVDSRFSHSGTVALRSGAGPAATSARARRWLEPRAFRSISFEAWFLIDGDARLTAAKSNDGDRYLSFLDLWSRDRSGLNDVLWSLRLVDDAVSGTGTARPTFALVWNPNNHSLTGPLADSTDSAPHRFASLLPAGVVTNSVPSAPLNVSAAPGDTTSTVTWDDPLADGTSSSTAYPVDTWFKARVEITQNTHDIDGTPRFDGSISIWLDLGAGEQLAFDITGCRTGLYDTAYNGWRTNNELSVGLTTDGLNAEVGCFIDDALVEIIDPTDLTPQLPTVAIIPQTPGHIAASQEQNDLVNRWKHPDPGRFYDPGDFVSSVRVGEAGGVAPLDENGLLPVGIIPGGAGGSLSTALLLNGTFNRITGGFGFYGNVSYGVPGTMLFQHAAGALNAPQPAPVNGVVHQFQWGAWNSANAGFVTGAQLGARILEDATTAGYKGMELVSSVAPMKGAGGLLDALSLRGTNYGNVETYIPNGSLRFNNQVTPINGGESVNDGTIRQARALQIWADIRPGQQQSPPVSLRGPATSVFQNGDPTITIAGAPFFTDADVGKYVEQRGGVAHDRNQVIPFDIPSNSGPTTYIRRVISPTQVELVSPANFNFPAATDITAGGTDFECRNAQIRVLDRAVGNPLHILYNATIDTTLGGFYDYQTDFGISANAGPAGLIHADGLVTINTPNNPLLHYPYLMTWSTVVKSPANGSRIQLPGMGTFGLAFSPQLVGNFDFVPVAGAANASMFVDNFNFIGDIRGMNLNDPINGLGLRYTTLQSQVAIEQNTMLKAYCTVQSGVVTNGSSIVADAIGLEHFDLPSSQGTKQLVGGTIVANILSTDREVVATQTVSGNDVVTATAAITAASFVGGAPGGFRFTTAVPHGLNAGDVVRPVGVSPAAYNTLPGANQHWTVASVPSTTQVIVHATNANGADATLTDPGAAGSGGTLDMAKFLAQDLVLDGSSRGGFIRGTGIPNNAFLAALPTTGGVLAGSRAQMKVMSSGNPVSAPATASGTITSIVTPNWFTLPDLVHLNDYGAPITVSYGAGSFGAAALPPGTAVNVITERAATLTKHASRDVGINHLVGGTISAMSYDPSTAGGTFVVVMTNAHGLVPGNRITIAGMANSNYNVTDVAVATTGSPTFPTIFTVTGRGTGLGSLPQQSGGTVLALFNRTPVAMTLYTARVLQDTALRINVPSDRTLEPIGIQNASGYREIPFAQHLTGDGGPGDTIYPRAALMDVFTPGTGTVVLANPNIDPGLDGQWTTIRNRGPDAIVFSSGSGVFIPGGSLTLNKGDTARFCNAGAVFFPFALWQLISTTVPNVSGVLTLDGQLSTVTSAFGTFGTQSYGVYPDLIFNYAAGTANIPTGVPADNRLGMIQWKGLNDNSSFGPRYSSAAAVVAYVDQAFTGTGRTGLNGTGGQLELQTATNQWSAYNPATDYPLGETVMAGASCTYQGATTISTSTLTGTQTLTVDDTGLQPGAGGALNVYDGRNRALIVYESLDATHFFNCRQVYGPSATLRPPASTGNVATGIITSQRNYISTQGNLSGGNLGITPGASANTPSAKAWADICSVAPGLQARLAVDNTGRVLAGLGITIDEAIVATSRPSGYIGTPIFLRHSEILNFDDTNGFFDEGPSSSTKYYSPWVAGVGYPAIMQGPRGWVEIEGVVEFWRNGGSAQGPVVLQNFVAIKNRPGVPLRVATGPWMNNAPQYVADGARVTTAALVELHQSGMPAGEPSIYGPSAGMGWADGVWFGDTNAGFLDFSDALSLGFWGNPTLSGNVHLGKRIDFLAPELVQAGFVASTLAAGPYDVRTFTAGSPGTLPVASTAGFSTAGGTLLLSKLTTFTGPNTAITALLGSQSILVASTLGYPASGSLMVTDNAGHTATITYAGVSSDHFQNCTGANSNGSQPVTLTAGMTLQRVDAYTGHCDRVTYTGIVNNSFTGCVEVQGPNLLRTQWTYTTGDMVQITPVLNEHIGLYVQPLRAAIKAAGVFNNSTTVLPSTFGTQAVGPGIPIMPNSSVVYVAPNTFGDVTLDSAAIVLDDRVVYDHTVFTVVNAGGWGITIPAGSVVTPDTQPMVIRPNDSVTFQRNGSVWYVLSYSLARPHFEILTASGNATVGGNGVFGGTLTSVGTLSTSALAVSQPTLGQPVFTYSSVATNDDPTETLYQFRTTTTSATPTPLGSITMPAGKTTFIEGKIVARRTGGSAGAADDAAAYVVDAVVKGSGGLVAANITPVAIESQAAWNVTVSVAGGIATINVIGALNNNIVWHGHVRAYPVGT